MSTLMQSAPAGETDGHFVVHGIAWAQYETLLQAFPETPGLRITYVDGRITFVSPSLRHDRASRRLSDLIKAVAAGFGVRYEESGSATYRIENAGAGVEGDDAFYFGPHADTMRTLVEVDLSAQPPPDLVLEVEATHPADDAVAAWGRIGVPEIWRHNVRKGTIQFLVRGEGGDYVAAPRSLAFPVLGPADVTEQLRLADDLGALDWNEQLRTWARETLTQRQTQ